MANARRLNAASVERPAITVGKEFADFAALLLGGHLVLQILVHVIANAKHAVDAFPEGARQETLRTELLQEHALPSAFKTNDEGIAPENRVRLFARGSTTRKGGRAFGLHSCAFAAHAMCGTVSAKCEGRGDGAFFTLELPVHPLSRVS